MSETDARQPAAIAPVRLRTLLLIRWIAAAGQLVTVLAVQVGLGYPLPLGPCLVAITVLAVSNLLLAFREPSRARLAGHEATLLLAFDLAQLAGLLYLTGGLANPFAILILAPVLVSATILSRAATIILTGLAITAITVLAFDSHPLPWAPDVLALPLTYVLGIWTALAVASVFISTYVWSVAEEARRMSGALAELQAALARSQRLSALDGLAAAAAHELGSPLATISVVAKELSREVPKDSPIAEDVALLQSQAERCRDILADIAAQPEDRGGEPFERLPLPAFVAAAVEDVATLSASVEVVAEGSGPEPLIRRRPELQRGLANLIQNAEQFARARVEIHLYWDDAVVRITIHDDGPGFAPAVLSAIGEPYISTRSATGEHMGLGIFIAQTVLERSGASLRFANRGGGEVVISWPRVMLDVPGP